MDLVNIRKKAQQEKEKKEKTRDSVPKQDQGKTEETEARPEVDATRRQKEAPKTETEEIRKSKVTPVQEVEGPSAPSVAVVMPEKTKEETYEIPSKPYSEEEDMVELVSFKLGDETYGVRIDRVKEILKPLKITPVPRTPLYLVGVTSLRGEIIPVFDLKKRLGLEGNNEERKKRILTLSVRNETMGALIDEVRGVVKLHRDSIEPPPTIITGIEADFLEGVSRIDDHFIGILNVEEVMKI